VTSQHLRRDPDAAAVIITKPEMPAVRFGPLTQQTAEVWASRLRMMLTSSAPAGTTVTVGSHDLELPHRGEHTIPATVDDLLPQMLSQPEGNGGTGFPDLYSRLVMRWGWERAQAMWQRACFLASAEAEQEADLGHAAAAVTRARDLLGLASQTTEEARQLMSSKPADLYAVVLGDACPSDLQDHLAAALRELRAAARVLRPPAAP
jgi:hypothetical protein